MYFRVFKNGTHFDCEFLVAMHLIAALELPSISQTVTLWVPQ